MLDLPYNALNNLVKITPKVLNPFPDENFFNLSICKEKTHCNMHHLSLTNGFRRLKWDEHLVARLNIV